MKDLIEEIQREIQKENIDGVMDCYTVKVSKSGQAVKRRFNDQIKALTAVDGLKREAESADDIVEVDIKDKVGEGTIDTDIEGAISLQVDDIFAQAASGEKPEEKEAESVPAIQSAEPETEEERDIKEVFAEFKDGTNFDDKEADVAQVSINTGDIETDIETDRDAGDQQAEDDLEENLEVELEAEEDSEAAKKVVSKPQNPVKASSGFNFDKTIAIGPDFKFEETVDETPEFSLDDDPDTGKEKKDADFDRPVVNEEGLNLDAPFDEPDDDDSNKSGASAEEKQEDDDIEYMNKKEMLKLAKEKGIDNDTFVKLRKLPEEKLRKKLKDIIAGKYEPEKKSGAGTVKKKPLRPIFVGSGIFAGAVLIAVAIFLFVSSSDKRDKKVASVSGDAAEKSQTPSPAVDEQIDRTVQVEDAISKDLKQAMQEPVAVEKDGQDILSRESVPAEPAADTMSQKMPMPLETGPPPPLPLKKVEKIQALPEKKEFSTPGQSRMRVDKYMPQGVAISETAPNQEGAYPYVIHIGSYKDQENATNLVIELRKDGLLAYTSYVNIPGKGVWHRAFVGFYGSQEEAQKFAMRLARDKSMDANVVKKPYVIQIGLFDSDMELGKVESDLWAKGYTPYTIRDSRDRTKTKLVLGAFDTAKEALDQVDRLRSEKFAPGIATR